MAFQAHILRFEAEATSEIRLHHHKGSALRGAFFHALRTDHCANPSLPSCRPCHVHDTCPICFLVSTIDDASGRGADVPRPYVVEPPIDAREIYRPGDRLDFNIILFSRALSLFPYVIVAARRMGEIGLGIGRGKFHLREVWAIEPLGGVQQRVLRQGDNLVRVPDVPVEHAQVVEAAKLLARPTAPDSHSPTPTPHSLHLTPYSPLPTPSFNIKLRFKTPLRLVTDGRLVQRLSFATLVRRLFERLSALWDAYAGEPLQQEDGPLAGDFATLLALADQVRAVEDETRWVELSRYSARQQRRMPMGGLVGEITFAGDLMPFLPWLIWGSITHVGKYAVMGNGWYEIERVEGIESRELGIGHRE